MSTTSIFGSLRADLALVEAAIVSVADVDNPGLAYLLDHILRTRGKRIRPALVLLSGQLFDYCVRRLTPLATAIELLHTATLIHDDFIDGAATRRGVPTLHSLVEGRVAVLIGDYLFARSASLCTQSEDVRVMSVFGRTLTEICDGEIRQAVSRHGWQQGRDSYYLRIASKTASLFGAAAEIGAIVSSAPPAAVDALRSYGVQLGLAFQIVDDVLDFTGDSETMGKPTGNDLRQGTLTLPAIWYLENCPDDDSIRQVFESGGDVDSMVSRAVAAVASSPAIDFALAEARYHCAQARLVLDHLPDRPSRRALLELTDYVLERAR